MTRDTEAHRRKVSQLERESKAHWQTQTKTQTQHTPGPWHVATVISPDLKPKARDELRVWASDRAGVCNILTRRQLGGKDAPEELANARLIAAAPESPKPKGGSL